MRPVARTPYRSLSLGMANPVQPSSSRKPTSSAAAIPVSKKVALSLVVTMPGRNAGEVSDSARRTAANTSGAVRSATAYQPAPTRHLSNRESSSR
jgi:hypothetical protein